MLLILFLLPLLPSSCTSSNSSKALKPKTKAEPTAKKPPPATKPAAEETSTTASPPVTTAKKAPPKPSSPPAGAIDYDTGRPIETPKPLPIWDTKSEADAIQKATAAMKAFARPQLAYDKWWADLAPMLSQQAQTAYAYTDPANVPAHTVTGTAKLVDKTSVYIARVQVPTDVGVYTILLSRRDGPTPWLVERLTPPEGLK